MTTRVKKCPQCGSERPLSEILCLNEISGGHCGFQLTLVAPTMPGELEETSTDLEVHEDVESDGILTNQLCPNGHPIEPGDILCSVCGTDIVDTTVATESGGDEEILLDDWMVLRNAPHVAGAERRVIARSRSDGREAVITIFREGSEPDQEVYDVLRTMDADHIAKLYENGRQDGQPFEITEYIAGGTFADFEIDLHDMSVIRRIVDEMSRALEDFSRVGLRHRDLTPNTIAVRTREPLDLVIEGFGSACLSEFDLDVVAPLETNIYMAPEAVAGGVTAASDWWSLGMILLEKISPMVFEGVNERAFLINTLTAGVSIPEGLDPALSNLLHGLLIRDRDNRFGAKEVAAWLNGELVPVPFEDTGPQDLFGVSIDLGGAEISQIKDYALAAAETNNWEEAKSHLAIGKLATWAEEAGLDATSLASLRTIARRDFDEDFKLAIILKILNPNMPLVQKGEIVNPSWLLTYPDRAYALVMGETSSVLEDLRIEPWIKRLRDRAEIVKAQAKAHQIDLDEDEFNINMLSTSRSRLIALWEERRKLFPDTDHIGLARIVDRKQRTEEDLILLMSADVGQFISIDEVISSAQQAVEQAGLLAVEDEMLRTPLVEMNRRELFMEIGERSADFSRVGNPVIDAWTDQFRLERRTSMSRALAILAVPREDWQQPSDQVYVSQILKHYAAKVETQIRQGPLARMRISPTSDRIDMVEFDEGGTSATALVSKILDRSGQMERLQHRRIVEDPIFVSRLRKLINKTQLYKRDTGIDGLYLGFPFVVMKTGSRGTRPRIAPVLLWPVRLDGEVGRNAFSLGFDAEREEVRINPALESYLGTEEYDRWVAAKDELLSGEVSISSIVDEFGRFGQPMYESLAKLPHPDTEPEIGEVQIHPSAVLFHMTFMGQEVIENLRHLASIPPDGTALEALLRLRTEPEDHHIEPSKEFERYFVADIDPSQEKAVTAARKSPGVVISGPPGTGKSQSLVNIVSDCIGRGESVLICCAKQAALDVVRKRVAGVGLADKVLTVTDVNKDREPVLRAVRAKLDDVLNGTDAYDRLQAEREEVAAKIEARERELEEYHTALYDQIGETGRTYRDVVAELVALEEQGDSPPIDAPMVRKCLDGMSLSELVELEESVATLAPFWIKAKPKNSANSRLLKFGWDKLEADNYRDNLKILIENEERRIAELPYDDAPIEVDNPAEAASISSTIVKNYEECKIASQHLAEWLFYFIDTQNDQSDFAGKSTDRFIPIVSEAMEKLLKVDSRGTSKRFSKDFVVETVHTLEYYLEKTKQVQSTSFWRIFNPRWYKSGSIVKKAIRAFGADYTPPLLLEFQDSLKQELELRPIRNSLQQVRDELNYAAEFDSLLIDDFRIETRDLLDRLQATKVFAKSVQGVPGIDELKNALRRESTEEVRKYQAKLVKSIKRKNLHESSISSLKRMTKWLEKETIQDLDIGIRRDADNREILNALRSDMGRVEAYQLYRHRIIGVENTVLHFFEELNSAWSSLSGLADDDLGLEVRRIINREARLAWKQESEEKTVALSFSKRDVKRKVNALSDNQNTISDLNRRLLAETYDRRRLGSKRDWEAITRLRGRRMVRLREFFDRGRELGLLDLQPIWMMNPDVAARMLPMVPSMFDVVIFDESSQLPVEYSLHVLFRAKRAVISGDAKQMPPTKFFQSRVEDDQAELEGDFLDEDASDEEREAIEREENSRDIKDCTDLLELASVPLPKHVLQIHYRSRFRELIGFSNASFYNNALHVPVRHPMSLVASRQPLEFIEVNGTYRHQTNKDEAMAIVERLARIWMKTDTPPSIGIISFNRKQADLIVDVVNQRASQDEAFRVALARESSRADNGEDMAFFVMNVENCQGLERDVIMFSSTFGRNDQGTFRRLFGVLGQKGGERRLNVAVTRAREKVIFFTSMPVAEVSGFLDERRAPIIARDYLQGYLEYARLMSGASFQSAETLLDQLVESGGATFAARKQSPDGFGQIVANYIKDLGHEPVSARDGTVFAIDYALPHPETGRFFIGIECDAPKHDLLAKARDREIWRPQVLKMGIPVIHRVSSAEWYMDRDRESSLLKSAIEDAFAIAREVA